MNRFFTSDQHFSHANVIKYCNRPFLTVEEMNEELVRRHNAVVGKNDEVLHLGDFSLSKGAVPMYLPRLNGKHTLIMGNHDHCHPLHAKSAEKAIRITREYHAFGFQEIMLNGRLSIAGQDVLLNHMPYAGDTHESEGRFKEYRYTDEGMWLIHGHVHQHWLKRGRQINVGVDVWAFAPVSEEEIAALINGHEGY